MNDQRFAEMISGIAHELRSPLTSVKGFSATLVARWERFTDEQKRQFVETINADADRMSRIIGEVLELARLETGRLDLNLRGVPVHEVAAAAVRVLAGRPGADRIVMAVDEDVVAFADPDRLQDVVMHLLENGIKFSEAGPVTLEAGAAGDVVEISVTDAGQGIEDARLPTVFAGPAPAGGRASPTGSGLGLYLSKRVIEAHGGTIGVRSVPGRTTFTIALPQEGARP